MSHQSKNQARSKHRGSSNSAVRYFVRAFLVWLAAAGIEIALHESSMSSWLTQQAYLFLHSNIALERRPEFPVVVVDLSRLRSTNGLTPVAEIPGLFVRSNPEYTNRKALTELMKRLAALDPACVGVDIDFSPLTPLEGGDGAPAPNQLELLDTCRDLRTLAGDQIPVFLGIMRTMYLPPDGWLGSAEHRNLAASIARFGERNSHMPYEFHPHPGSDFLPSLSMACANSWLQAHHLHPAEPSKWQSPFLEGQMKEHLTDGMEDCWVTSFPVNYYSTLPALEASRIPAEDILMAGQDKLNALRQKIYQKMVLVGYATRLESFDTVILPGEPDPVPGVYMHACAAATLVASPLFEVKAPAGFGLSLLLSMSAAALAFRLKGTYNGQRMGLIALELLFVLATIVVTCLGAFALVKWMDVLWLQVTSLWLFLAVEFSIGVLTPSSHD